MHLRSPPGRSGPDYLQVPVAGRRSERQLGSFYFTTTFLLYSFKNGNVFLELNLGTNRWTRDRREMLMVHH